jgi:hypothetical protein
MQNLDLKKQFFSSFLIWALFLRTSRKKPGFPGFRRLRDRMATYGGPAPPIPCAQTAMHPLTRVNIISVIGT